MSQKSFAHFGQMTWPCPGDRLAEIGYRLRYAPDLPIEDRLVAASVIGAYAQLIHIPERQRRYVVRELRKAIATAGGDPA